MHSRRSYVFVFIICTVPVLEGQMLKKLMLNDSYDGLFLSALLNVCNLSCTCYGLHLQMLNVLIGTASDVRDGN
jgi:hypothetical protein